MQPFALDSFGARLHALRQTKSLSQSDLASLIGRHQTAIGPYERNEYMPSRDVVAKLAEALGTSPEYLYFGRSPSRSAIATAGTLTAAGNVPDTTTNAKANVLTLLDDQVIGYFIEDRAMEPVFPSGHILLVRRRVDEQPEALIGQDVLATLADGRSFLRHMNPDSLPGFFSLSAYNAPTLYNCDVRSARETLGSLSLEAFAAIG